MLIEEHSKKQCTRIKNEIFKNEELIEELMHCFFSEDYRLAQRAAWPVSRIAEERSEILHPYFKKMVDCLGNTNSHNAVIRNTVRVFQFADIIEDIEGPLYDQCMKFIADPKIPVGIRAFSMTVASRVAEKYPELREELIGTIKLFNTPDAKPAYKARAKQAFKMLGFKL